MKKHLYVLSIFLLTSIFILHKETPIYTNVNKLTGDTIEFKASSFVIQPNDKLGKLIQQLPNVSINSKDVIVAQGEVVKLLYLDGEEYFTDTPNVGLKNIRADIVDKIQFYHKISDQATFTGIEEKNMIKTINVVLKKHK